jgi:hypothetical protein
LDDQDDLDGHFLFAPARTDEPGNCPAGGSRQRPRCVSGELFQTDHPGRPGHPYASPTAISCNHQGRPLFSGGRPGRPGAAWHRPARACPRSSPRGAGAALGRPFDERSYACSVEVRMKGDIDDPQKHVSRAILSAHRHSPSNSRRRQRDATLPGLVDQQADHVARPCTAC